MYNVCDSHQHLRALINLHLFWHFNKKNTSQFYRHLLALNIRGILRRHTPSPRQQYFTIHVSEILRHHATSHWLSFLSSQRQFLATLWRRIRKWEIMFSSRNVASDSDCSLDYPFIETPWITQNSIYGKMLLFFEVAAATLWRPWGDRRIVGGVFFFFFRFFPKL